MKLKKILAALLSLAMVLAVVNVSVSAEGEVLIPTATVTEIENEDLTFALNFKTDESTADQLAYYGDWYADFELVINKDVTFNAYGDADGYLAGQYDAWSKNWVKVPFSDVSYKAGDTLRIMEYAAKLMGKPGLKYTYAEVYKSVKDFDCGVFFTPEFLAENPDLEVTLELKMYNPENEAECYTIGETYKFYAVALAIPTATVTRIVAPTNPELTFALNFNADEVTPGQLTYFGDWYADFVLTVNTDVTFNANGTADGYLAGQYDGYGENWLSVPFEDVTLKAGESFRIMEYASTIKPEFKITYNDVVKFVKEFNCGVYFTPEFLAENPDLEVSLSLNMYNPVDETESYTVGEVYDFEPEGLVSVKAICSDKVEITTTGAEENNVVLVAAYDKDGRLLETKLMTVTAEQFESADAGIQTDLASIKTIRAFLVEDLTTLTPLCNAGEGLYIM